MDEAENDAARRAELLAEVNEVLGATKQQYRSMFQVPRGKWKIGSIWEQAYLETAQYVLKAVLSGGLNPNIHGVVGVFLFRHYVELELKYILLHTRWLIDREKNATRQDVREIKKIHDLAELWRTVRTETPDKIGREAWDGFDTEFVDKLVGELHEVDPRSFAFRYSGEKIGEGDPEAEEVRIDFGTILEQSQHAYNVLHSIQVYLVETYGQNAEWEAEMNTW